MGSAMRTEAYHRRSRHGRRFILPPFRLVDYA
nr:MAG TPA: hypothetical protein [Caudoviricetes sp.]